MKEYRNSQKRIYLENAVYFLTVCADGRFPYFYGDPDGDTNLTNNEGDNIHCRLLPIMKSNISMIQNILCELWFEELKITQNRKGFELCAWCLLDDHFHMMIRPKKDENISRILQYFKKQFSRNANILLGYNDFDLCRIKEGDNEYCRISEINTLNQKILTWKKSIPLHHNIPLFQWQKSFHDHIIRDEQDYEKHWNYTTFNYLKHGLPDDWKWTSEKRSVN